MNSQLTPDKGRQARASDGSTDGGAHGLTGDGRAAPPLNVARQTELLDALEKMIAGAVHVPKAPQLPTAADAPPLRPAADLHTLHRSKNDAYRDRIAQIEPRSEQTIPKQALHAGRPQFGLRRNDGLRIDPQAEEYEPAEPPQILQHRGHPRQNEADDEARREEALRELRRRQRPLPPAEIEPRPRGRAGLLLRLSITGLVAGAAAFFIVVIMRSGPPVEVTNTISMVWSRLFGGAVPNEAHALQSSHRLMVTELSGVANRPIAVGVNIESPPSGSSIVVKGLPPGSRVTVGTQAGDASWRIPVREIARAAIVPPQDFVGTVNLPIDLKLADGSVADSHVLRLEWTGAGNDTVVPKSVKTSVVSVSPAGAAPVSAPPPQAAPAAVSGPALAAATSTPIEIGDAGRAYAAVPVSRQLPSDELQNLVKRGTAFLQNGDISAARLVLRRAAESGHAQSALALGTTYDPNSLRELGVLGATGDIAEARGWYEKAAELGSAEALRRLERLPQPVR